MVQFSLKCSTFFQIQAAQEHGMGPRGSALICGYTNYHRLLESSLAQLKKKEVIDDGINYNQNR